MIWKVYSKLFVSHQMEQKRDLWSVPVTHEGLIGNGAYESTCIADI